MQPLVKIEKVSKHFATQYETVYALDNINLTVNKGEILALVGESGSGKSTLGKAILNLQCPTSGSIFFDGIDVAKSDKGTLRQLRKRMQIVLQNPYSSLNPVKKVSDIVGEGLDIHKIASGRERNKLIEKMLSQVGLPKEMANSLPRECSGGQRQRISIARSLILNPEFLVLDEPISSLDVTTQAQLIKLLLDLQQSLGLTYLFISHDLAMVRYFADRVAVMYCGKIVEFGETKRIFSEPRHPYTQALISASPLPDPIQERTRSKIVLVGEMPSRIKQSEGCAFYSRCFKATEMCKIKTPALIENDGGFYVCHY